jgi:hypothetical protein
MSSVGLLEKVEKEYNILLLSEGLEDFQMV